MEITSSEHSNTPEVVEADVLELTQKANELAKQVAEEEQFNNGAADILLRNPAGLLNNFSEQDRKNFAGLSSARVDEFHDLTVRAIDFLGESSKTEAEMALTQANPQTENEAKFVIMQSGLNSLQSAVSVGPSPEVGGYDPAKEVQLRHLVVDATETFSRAYRELAAKGHDLATKPEQRKYFEGNVKSLDKSEPSESFVDFI